MEEEIKVSETDGDEITSDDKIWALLGYIIGIVALLACCWRIRRTGRLLDTMLSRL